MWERTLIEGLGLWRVSKGGIHTSFKYAHINFWNYLFAFCSFLQLHGIQSFLLCLAHRKNISGWLRKSSCRSRSTMLEGRQSSSLTVGLCCAAERSIQRYSGETVKCWWGWRQEQVVESMSGKQSLDWLPGAKVMRSPSLGWLLLLMSQLFCLLSQYWITFIKGGLFFYVWVVFFLSICLCTECVPGALGG